MLVNGFLPVRVLREAIKAVPPVKYALGVAGIVAIVAIVQAFRLDLKVAVFGTLVTFAFMVLLVVFAKLTTIAPRHFLLPVLATTWAFLVLAIASAVLLFVAVFFGRPKGFHDWLLGASRPALSVHSPQVPAELIKAAQMQSSAGDYEAAWKQIDEALKSGPNSQEALRIQTQIAMDWLRNIRIIKRTGKETFSEIVDLVSPGLYRAASSAKGVWAGDIQAHLGWGSYLKYTEGMRGLDIDRHFQEALKLDQQNVFAHAMWGFWILWNSDDVSEANKHFAAAVQSGREPDYVKDLHAAALLNRDTKETRLEIVRFANQLRLNRQSLDPDIRDRILWRVYTADAEEMIDNLESGKPVLPPSEHLATLNWLGEGLDKSMRELTFFTARLKEAMGDSSGALLLYRSLKQSRYAIYGRLQVEIDRGIARCDKEGTNAVPKLLHQLKQTNSETRLMAVDSLAELRPDPNVVTPALTEALKDKDERVREHAIRALGTIASNDTAVVSALVGAIKDESQEVRSAACQTIAEIGRPAVPELVALLKGEEYRARENAKLVLEKIGRGAADAVPQLTDLLKDPNGEIRAAALSVLGAVGPEAKVAVPTLIELVKNGSSAQLRESAAYALGAIGPGAKDAVPVLIKMLKDRDGEPGYRGCAAADALGSIGPASAEAVPALAEALEAYDHVRLPSHAADALGKLGADAKMAIPALIQALKDVGKDYKRYRVEPLTIIATALRDKGDVGAIPLLRDIVRAFEDENFGPKIISPVRDALESLKELQQSKK